MSGRTGSLTASAHAFDSLAETYDEVFTESTVGKAQREAVWERAAKVFPADARLLELNCGTGEDAIHFTRLGFDVTACDISAAMIQRAKQKAAFQGVKHIAFDVRAIEAIEDVPHEPLFQCAFSNFSGLNCVQDLGHASTALSRMVQPHAQALFCLSTRVCVWEVLWYLAHGNIGKAFRRFSGQHDTSISGMPLSVFYPTVKQIRRCFAPYFRVVAIHGIGVTVPPSYVESWIASRPRLLQVFRRIDAVVCGWPGVRVLGDHMLIQLERTSADA